MNPCKVTKLQARYTKAPMLSTCGGGGCVKFVGTKNCLTDCKEVNSLVALAMVKANKINKSTKGEDTNAYYLDNE